MELVQIDRLQGPYGPVVVLLSHEFPPAGALDDLAADGVFAWQPRSEPARDGSTGDDRVDARAFVMDLQVVGALPAGGGASPPPLISLSINATNNGVKATDYSLLLPREVENPLEAPVTIRGGLTLRVTDIDGNGGAGIATFNSMTPVYAAYVDTLEKAQHTLFGGDYLLGTDEPFGSANDSDAFARDPVPTINDMIYVWIRSAIAPKTSVTYGIELEALSCRGDCVPENLDGSIGSGVINVDDLLEVVNSFGAKQASPCDIMPVNPDGSYGNNVINIDDLIEMINLFGECPGE